MTQSSVLVEELVEYESKPLPKDRITADIERVLDESYVEQVTLDAPSYKTSGQWRLTAQGWVGYIPVTPEFALRLMPKVEVERLFAMLEYAYRLRSFRFLDDLVGCTTLEDYYERLAKVLARRVLDRGRKGFYRDYVMHEERLPYVRGRMDVVRTAVQPWEVQPHCNYQEHTADIEENQLVAWTLWDISRRGICTERVLPTVRQAYRTLQGLTTLQPFSPAACINRRYNRLNEDYHPLHALCRFFLEQTGPSHRQGDRQVLPFLVNMESLFELFVAEWLKAHLPPRWSLRVQERVLLVQAHDLHYTMDLVIHDGETGRVACVLDTKYKVPEQPSPGDIQQVQAYAHTLSCKEGILVYPRPLDMPLDTQIQDIRLRSLTFSLAGDLEEAGQEFMKALLADL